MDGSSNNIYKEENMDGSSNNKSEEVKPIRGFGSRGNGMEKENSFS